MTDHGQDRFDEAFRGWASRAPSTPADIAASRLVARLSEQSREGWFAGGWLPAASVAAALALVLVLGWATLPSGRGAGAGIDEMTLPPLEGNVVLLWLDDQTPLYLTVAPPATEGGSR